MNETELTIPERYALLDRGRAGGTYAYQWHAFVDWCKETGVESLPASSEDVARYLEARAEAGARPSTIKVVAAASRAQDQTTRVAGLHLLYPALTRRRGRTTRASVLR